MKKITQLLCTGLLFCSAFMQAQTARVQIIHNSPDLSVSLVDVYVNNTLFLNDVAFRTASPFVTVPAGVALSIAIAPSTSTSATQSIYNLSTTFTSGSTYIVVANGIISTSGYTPSPAFTLNIFSQGREVAANPTSTDVLVYHGSPDAPTVDVVETSVPAGTVVNNISYPSFLGYLGLINMDYVLDVRNAAGTVTLASYEAPLQTLNLQGAAITILASGFLDPTVNSNGPAFGLWVALATGGPLVALQPSVLKTSDFKVAKILLYPNPTTGNLNLEIPFSYEKFEGKVLDLSGREMKSFTDVKTLDASNLTSGYYFLTLNIDGKVYNQKFLKE